MDFSSLGFSSHFFFPHLNSCHQQHPLTRNFTVSIGKGKCSHFLSSVWNTVPEFHTIPSMPVAKHSFPAHLLQAVLEIARPSAFSKQPPLQNTSWQQTRVVGKQMPFLLLPCLSTQPRAASGAVTGAHKRKENVSLFFLKFFIYKKVHFFFPQLSHYWFLYK